MPQMAFENCYISANCNPTPTVAHWGHNNLICYGSSNAILIYDLNLGSGGKIIDTLVAHKNRVNSVRWINGKDRISEVELVSGSSDGTAIVWTYNGTYVPFVLKGHVKNVTIVDGLYKEPGRHKTVIATASMDSSVKVWFRETPTDVFTLREDLKFGDPVCVGLKLTTLPNTNTVLMACAMDNSVIQLYHEMYIDGDNASIQLVKSACLVGHEDWVRGLDFTTKGQDILLASSSQDGFIRLWRLTEESRSHARIKSVRSPLTFATPTATYHIALESVIPAHDGWVYSVHWNPRAKQQLLSASIDKTMVIWEYDMDALMWTETARLGEVGGNTLGFYGGFFGPDGVSVCGHGYHGALHMWRSEAETGAWQPLVTVGGHFGEVVDLAWEPDGEFVVSAGGDQTVRVHAPWHKEVEPVTWHEIARPQVHGHDMYSLAMLSRYKYASSAEEKVIRVFHATKNFIENFSRICQFADCEKILKNLEQSGPEGASVPSLGLSNKAVFGTDNNRDRVTSKKDPYPAESRFRSLQLQEPPTEETLMENTLWPELQKLYGHGYEVYCLGASHDGKLLASSCKSTTKQHAAIILWDTDQWRKIQELISHTLTVVQIAFSHDDQHILSVSRDRRWSLFRRQLNSNEYTLVATTDKATGVHTRIIWSCAWSPDSKYFATGSRDGKVVMWTRNEEKESKNCLGQYQKASNHLEQKNESITALAFAPMQLECRYLLAVGFETGKIVLYSWNLESFLPLLTLSEKCAHHLTVKRLAFRPVLGKAGYKEVDENILQLASCSSDHSVRIYNIFLNELLSC